MSPFPRKISEHCWVQYAIPNTLPSAVYHQARERTARSPVVCPACHYMPPSVATYLARLRRVGSGRLTLVAELGDRGGALPTRINRFSAEGNDVIILHCRW